MTGLEPLINVSQLVIKQKKDLLEVVLGWEKKNKYEIMTMDRSLILKAKEESGCCTRMFFGPSRPFDMNFISPNEQLSFSLQRPFKCTTFPCCSCCKFAQHTVRVNDANGSFIGSVDQVHNCTKIEYRICDRNGNKVFSIKGGSYCLCPFVGCCRPNEFKFSILGTDDVTEVACITKTWRGLATEVFTDADSYHVQFPMDLSVDMKSLIVSATILIDFMYFEKSKNNN